MSEPAPTVVFNDGVCNHAIRPNAHALAQVDFALKDAIHINAHIVRAKQIASHINTRWIRQAYTFLHQTVGLCKLEGTF